MNELENQAEDLAQEEFIEEQRGFDEYEEAEDYGEAEPSESEAAELAPDSEPEHEENAEVDNQAQDRTQEVINMKHRQMKEAQERAAKAEEQLAQMQQMYQPKAPEVPPVPDYLDDDYDDKMRQREQAIQQRAVWDAQQQSIQQQQLQRQQQQQLKQQQEMANKVTTYNERAAKLGVKQEDLQKAAQVVGMYVNDRPGLVDHILTNEKGALITQYLSRNISELETLSSLNDTDAAVYIAENIKPKLAFKKQTKAPRPAKRATTGAPKSDSNNLRGAKFY